MRITADPGRCLGAGQCVLSAPDRFDQSEEGTVLVLDARVADEADETRLRETVSLCPSQAIALVADDSATVVAGTGGVSGTDGVAGPDAAGANVAGAADAGTDGTVTTGGADRTVSTVADAGPAGPGADVTGIADVRSVGKGA
ncbi:ferredoxin [Streptomyces sp. NPDC006602]|uniref:ferredoxin n=1 Tax=Streptomyces sp. NPDC006602 TaxID=3364751 RepID=UPI0036D13AAA